VPVLSEYSAFRALDLAVTVTFSIENAISLNVITVPSPSASASSWYAYPDLRCKLGLGLTQRPGLVTSCAVVPKPTLQQLSCRVRLPDHQHSDQRMQYLLRRTMLQFHLIGIAGTHCEDQSSRTVHWLNACEVICDQVRHCASDQEIRTGSKPVRGKSSRSRLPTELVGASERNSLSSLSMFFLVLQENCGNHSLRWESLMPPRPS